MARGREREHRGHFDREAGLRIAAPELARARLIHHEQQGDLALFVERLHERMPHPGRDVPVDRAEVIPLLVGPHLCELEAMAAEHGAIVPGEEGVDESPGAELDPLDLPEDLGSDCPAARPDRGRRGAPALASLVPHGTSTASRIFAITPSGSMSSASASKDRKSTRLNSSHRTISYAVFCLKKKKINTLTYLLYTPTTFTTDII